MGSLSTEFAAEFAVPRDTTVATATIALVRAAAEAGRAQLGSAHERLLGDDAQNASMPAALLALGAACGGAPVDEAVLVAAALSRPATPEAAAHALAAGQGVLARLRQRFTLTEVADAPLLMATVAGAGIVAQLEGQDAAGRAAAMDIAASLLPAAAQRPPQVRAALAGLAADQAVRAALEQRAGFVTPPAMIETVFGQLLAASATRLPADAGSARVVDGLIDFVERHRDGHAFPPEVLRAATRDIADTLANVVGGAGAAPVRALLAEAGPGAAAARAWPGVLGLAPLSAARLMSVSALWLDLDTGIYRHPATRRAVPTSHPTIHILPAMLGELRRTPVDQHLFLTAFTLGYEVSARLSAGCHLRTGVHPHGVAAAAGTAVALGLMRGHDRATLARGLDLACDLARVPLMASALRGGSVRNLNGAAGLTGAWLATRLAEAGWQGAGDPGNGALGAIAADWLDSNTVLKDLGSHWEMTLGYIKVHACCRFNHPALDVLLDLIDRHRFGIAEVEHIEVRTFGNAAMMDNPAPRTDLGAKFSIPWSMASATAFGHAGVAAFEDAALARPDIQALATRVSVTEDPAFTAAMPARRPTTVAVQLRDGRRLSGETDHSRGDPPDPFPAQALDDKFRALLGLGQAYTETQASERLRAIHGMHGQTAPAQALFA